MLATTTTRKCGCVFLFGSDTVMNRCAQHTGAKFGAEQPRAIHQIAREIQRDWKNPYFGAVPYLHAMLQIEKLDDWLGHETAKSIVLYFLSNAKTWRGGVARHIKAELNAMLKSGENQS